MDLYLGAHVDALGRLLQEQHRDPTRQPFGQDHLLVAARQRTGRKLRATRADVEQVHQLVDDALARAPIDPAEARQRVEIRQQDVVAHRLVHHQAEPRSPGTMPMPTAIASAGC